MCWKWKSASTHIACWWLYLLGSLAINISRDSETIPFCVSILSVNLKQSSSSPCTAYTFYSWNPAELALIACSVRVLSVWVYMPTEDVYCLGWWRLQSQNSKRSHDAWEKNTLAVTKLSFRSDYFTTFRLKCFSKWLSFCKNVYMIRLLSTCFQNSKL